ncbi:cell wall metabolism sensor histidine kinase WalK [uncultured Eubacterium sp.]|uniref:sensor histidine kinase n=1 Tax=uncultured Eubacterium sp. TaxID=165185 RepID=UPI0026713569|nr:ATP-binding protein [uncultured Eubacterium sp.]
MKKKLYTRMTTISVIMMLLTMSVTIGIFYSLFREQVMDDLKTHVHILRTTEAVLEYIEKDFDPQIDNLRITVVGNSGEVKYDSNADIGTMENHGDRPEVHEALKYGSGEAIRKSGTFDKTTYYYAEKMDGGQVIRVAKEVGSIWQFCVRILPVLIAELFLAVVICIVVARLLAKRLVEPIEQMAQNLEDEELSESYEEIQPFLDKIHSQHKDLKKSAKMRQDFTANVSHELKTPLASISGYAELIETGMAKEKDIQHFASEIHKSSIRLLSLINDIIELSQLDVMGGDTDKIRVNLSEEAHNCVEMLQMNADKHDISILVKEIQKNCFIEANQEMIQEIVFNLCDNAIRYNKPGGHVWVSVYEKKEKVILRVKDDGIGIAQEEQERIFERFYRVDKARSKKTGGTGLGLAIVKHIAEQHNAEIEIDSEIGQGTIISVVFMKYHDKK